MSFLLGSGTLPVESQHHLRLTLFHTLPSGDQTLSLPLLFPSPFHRYLLADLSHTPQSGNLKTLLIWKPGDQKWSLGLQCDIPPSTSAASSDNWRASRWRCLSALPLFAHLLPKDIKQRMQVAFLMPLGNHSVSESCLTCLFISTAWHSAWSVPYTLEMFVECLLTLDYMQTYFIFSLAKNGQFWNWILERFKLFIKILKPWLSNMFLRA